MTDQSGKALQPSKTLFALTIVMIFNFIDRQIVVILAEDIKADLLLSDTQLGLLTGLAFAILYSTLALPIARLAEWHSRINIISLSLAFWSIMTAAAGVAQNFAQLAAARVGVGIGEAGAVPASHSIISSLYSPENRSSAMAKYQVGIPIGVLLGFLIGGILGQFIGWRATLVAVGLPGALIAIWVWRTIPEPPRNLSADSPTDFFEDARILLSNRTFVYLTLAAMTGSFSAYAVISWIPIMMLREFSVTSAEVGVAMAALSGLVGGIGTILVGYLSDRSLRLRAGGPLLVAGLVAALSLPFFILALLADEFWPTLLFLGPAFLLYLSWTGPLWAQIHDVAPTRMRSTASAIVLLALNLFGLGGGPLFVGIVSDWLYAEGFEATSLRIAIAAGSLGFVASSLFFLLAAHIKRAGRIHNDHRLS